MFYFSVFVVFLILNCIVFHFLLKRFHKFPTYIVALCHVKLQQKDRKGQIYFNYYQNYKFKRTVVLNTTYSCRFHKKCNCRNLLYFHRPENFYPFIIQSSECFLFLFLKIHSENKINWHLENILEQLLSNWAITR